MYWILTALWWIFMICIAQVWPIVGGLLIGWTIISWFYTFVTTRE